MFSVVICPKLVAVTSVAGNAYWTVLKTLYASMRRLNDWPPGKREVLVETQVHVVVAVAEERVARDDRVDAVADRVAPERRRRQNLRGRLGVVDRRAKNRLVDENRPAFRESVEVEVDAGLRDGERRPGGEPHDRGDLPPARQNPDQVTTVAPERQQVAAVEAEAMRRVEPRVAARVARIGTKLIRVAGADERRLGCRVLRLAARVGRGELQTLAEALGPFELNAVVPGLGVVADPQVRRVARIRPALVGARHAQADLVVGDRHVHGAGGIRGEVRAGPVPAHCTSAAMRSMTRPRRSGNPGRRRVVRMIDDEDRPEERRLRQVVERVLQRVDDVIAVVGHAQARVERQPAARSSGSTGACTASADSERPS